MSVIIPVRDDKRNLEDCLASLRRSTFRDFEILVTDDASSPAHAQAHEESARRHGARLIRLEAQSGPAAARNRAAREARAAILVFLDADVRVHADTLERLAGHFGSDPDLAAVMGSYDDAPTHPGVLSAFRNLMHHWIHQRSAGEARTFWTGCGAIRRDWFERSGGFNESYRRPSAEDVELGMRIHALGGKLKLDGAVQVCHQKGWTLAGALTTDFRHRGIPWAELVRRHGMPQRLNFGWNHRVTPGLLAAAGCFLLLAILHGGWWWGAAPLALMAAISVQAPLYLFLRRRRGAGFALASIPLHWMHYAAGSAGFVAGLLRWEIRRDRWLLPAAGSLLAAVALVQWANGAYRAEFGAHPDEAAHAVTTLMVRDYLAWGALEDPWAFAQRYYARYPKVALGHWPPLYYGVQGAWLLMLPPARWSLLLFQAALAFACGLLFYLWTRGRFGSPAALALALVLISVQQVQLAASSVMSDALSLLLGLAAAAALGRLASAPSPSHAMLTGGLIALALLNKGTGALLLAPAAAVVAASRRFRLLAYLAAPVALLAGPWYLLQYGFLESGTLQWVGAGWNPAAPLAGLGGVGLALLSGAGAILAWRARSRQALAVAAILLAGWLIPLGLGAFNEPRHLLVAWPALVWLAGWALVQRPLLVSPLAVAAVATLPLVPRPQQPEGFRELAAAMRAAPAAGRMLVSSASTGEGQWIAEMALADGRRERQILRASKTLARTNWSGTRWRAAASTSGEMRRLLDELKVQLVVLHQPEGRACPPHQDLLAASVESWPLVASAPGLRVHRRPEELREPPSPLVIDLSRRIGVVLRQ